MTLGRSLLFTRRGKMNCGGEWGGGDDRNICSSINQACEGIPSLTLELLPIPMT